MSVLISGAGIHPHPYLLYYADHNAGGAPKVSLDTNAIVQINMLRAGSYVFMSPVSKIEGIFIHVRD